MPNVGEAFDRYTIEAVLGEGGMGVVYRAFDPRLNRYVALKVVRAQKPGDTRGATENATARLLREARAAAALDHPNAVAIFDLGEVDGETFIAMELVSGRALRVYVDQPQIPITMRLRWLNDIARVLAAAHRAGLVHRDIKPENVMVRDDGDVKVLDFGIARSVLSESARPLTDSTPGRAVTERSLMAGTPLYMAPEQIRGGRVDGRADQFAWGVLAYELLAGRVPWAERATEAETLTSILRDEPAPLAAIAADLPPAVAEVVNRALRKDADDRFPSMESVVNILEPVLGPASKLPPTISAMNPMLPFQRTVTTGDASFALRGRMDAPTLLAPRSRRPLALGLGSVVAVIAAAALFLARPRRLPEVLPAAAAASAASAGHPLPAAPAAASAYAMATQALHEGMSRVAAELLKKVIDLEPSFAPAVLRLALLDYGANESLKEARELFQRAAVMRATLPAEDGALLDALSPCILHYDMAHGECEERLDDAARRYPDDLDILRELAGQQMFADKVEPAIATCRKALLQQPTYVYFSGLMGEMQAYAGRLDEALRTLDECTRTRPEATGCIDNRIAIHVQRDECVAVESDARDWISAAPRDGGRWGPHHYLADAQIALGRPGEAVSETLAQEWARTPDGERAGTEALDRATLAILGGDFAGAEAQITNLEKLTAGDDAEEPHATPAGLRVQLDEEEGRVAEAGEVADAFLRRRESWTRDTREDDWEIAQDLTMRMNDALRRAGKITPAELGARREAWRAHWERTRVARFDWFPAYAYWVSTSSDAREALAAMPDGGLPPYRPYVYAEGATGRTYALAGDEERAIPLLNHAAEGCYALEDPFTTVQSHLWLGRALEKTSDVPGACAAYAFVVDHWGNAKPRSVTAAEARGRRAALRCAR